MHIQKLLAVICMAALAGASSEIYASDTSSDRLPQAAVVVTPPPQSRLSQADEAKVREQLRQTIADLNAQGGVAKPVTPIVVPPQEAKPMTPVMQPVMVKPTPVTTGKLSAEDEAKVREQMRQAIADLNAKDAAAQASAPVIVPGAASSEKMTVTKAPKVKKLPPADASMAEQKQEMKKEQKSGQLETIPVSTAMIPGSKEQRLADLLQLYKTDKISPSEYHQQRAKIVSEP